jgi:hypothetical protein
MLTQTKPLGSRFKPEFDKSYFITEIEPDAWLAKTSQGYWTHDDGMVKRGTRMRQEHSNSGLTPGWHADDLLQLQASFPGPNSERPVSVFSPAHCNRRSNLPERLPVHAPVHSPIIRRSRRVVGRASDWAVVQVAFSEFSSRSPKGEYAHDASLGWQHRPRCH